MNPHKHNSFNDWQGDCSKVQFVLVDEKGFPVGTPQVSLQLGPEPWPGFPFRDIPTEMMVHDIPRIHFFKQMGVGHAIQQIPRLRKLKEKMRVENGYHPTVPEF